LSLSEEPVSCSGINGSISLFNDRIRIVGGRLAVAETHEIACDDVSSIVVQRKSVVPFATVTVLLVILTLISEYNVIWFIDGLTSTNVFIPPFSMGIAILSLAITILRLLFVNVSINSGQGSVVLRLVTLRSAKRLAKRFSEISGGG
jgi:hypothetical protein